MAGTSKPNYGRCVAIVTAAAQKELLGPGILAIGLPCAVAFGFSIGKPPTMIGGHMYNLTGAEALGGFLAGAIASGQLMAVLLANSGGMWDNAKKLIEDGLYGGKGTDAHKAGVVCDTVGDPFKDTAGPALNPLIKVMNLVALLLAGVVVMPLATPTLILITAIAVGALAASIFVSKKSSMSTEMAKVTTEAPEIPAPAALEEVVSATPPKRRITVEEPVETTEPEEKDEK
jgi:K(+)-stimulated pyrophosphate-energized sodium pump